MFLKIENGEAFAWGNGLSGQLGNGNMTVCHEPVKMMLANE
jgi:hypothetical protein